MRIGLLTGGGDAPGLNAVIRAVVKTAASHGAETIGIEDGFAGLIEPHALASVDARGSARHSPPRRDDSGDHQPAQSAGLPSPAGAAHDYAAQCVHTFHALGLDALVVIGGDGTLAIAHEFHTRGIPLVGVPKTIDNDIVGTASTFGFDTAVGFATEAIDRLHTTAEAHHRIMVVELMGRYTGWIALHAGIAGGADVILIPEIPYDLAKVAELILARERLGARFSIVAAAEGARPVGGSALVQQPGSASAAERLGGIGAQIASQLESITGKEGRSVLLGHLQRGGSPTSVDRLLATRFGTRATELVLAGNWGTMVALQPPDIVAVPLATVAGGSARCRWTAISFTRPGRSAWASGTESARTARGDADSRRANQPCSVDSPGKIRIIANSSPRRNNARIPYHAVLPRHRGVSSNAAHVMRRTGQETSPCWSSEMSSSPSISNRRPTTLSRMRGSWPAPSAPGCISFTSSTIPSHFAPERREACRAFPNWQEGRDVTPASGSMRCSRALTAIWVRLPSW